MHPAPRPDEDDEVAPDPAMRPWSQPHEDRRLLASDRLRPLSARELDVVQQLVDGHSTDLGSKALYISRHTFRTHVKNILHKLDLHSSLELVSVAVECGMRPQRLSA